VVCDQHEALLLDANTQEVMENLKKAAIEQKQMMRLRWHRLVRSLLVHYRLKESSHAWAQNADKVEEEISDIGLSLTKHHTHVFEEESTPFDESNGIWRKTCSTCGLVVEFEKI